jgi:hypothetical protein
MILLESSGIMVVFNRLGFEFLSLGFNQNWLRSCFHFRVRAG